MWGTSRVINNKLYHPFHWPWFVFGFLVLLYSGILGLFYYFSYEQKNNPSKILYEKSLETRRQELINFKLSGLEPYVWRPLFKCNSLEEKETKNKTNSECIKASLKFIPSKKYSLNHFQKEKGNLVEYIEKPPSPCLICHQSKSGSLIKWTFDFKVKNPSLMMASLWGTQDFIYFNLAILILFALYIIFRVIFHFTRANDLIAVSVKTGRDGITERIMAKELKADRRLFLYIEITQNFVSGYIPRRHMMRLYKKYFTGDFDFSELDLRVGIVEYNSVSFEGLRIAQAIASKALSSSLIVQDKVLALSGPDVKKAIWKRKNSQLEFNVIDIKKDNK